MSSGQVKIDLSRRVCAACFRWVQLTHQKCGSSIPAVHEQILLALYRMLTSRELDKVLCVNALVHYIDDLMRALGIDL